MSDTPFTVRPAPWDTEANLIRAVRQSVFIEEQNVPPELDFDGSDPDHLHFLALDPNQTPIGTARLNAETGRVGRMAVLKPWRHHGVGRTLMQTIIDHAQSLPLTQLNLHAQNTAIPFYQKFHFTITGPEFTEANIPHHQMSLPLANS
ncbi:MAG: GNAT family N-acetyltransferase [Verrucomicrobiota bacterium]